MVYAQCTWPVQDDIAAACYSSSWRAVGEHSSPEETCRCGIYACTRPDRIRVEYSSFPFHKTILMVAGVVLCTGVVLYGDNVIRAARAKVLCLTDGPAASVPMETKMKCRDRLEVCAQHYRVPAVAWENLTKYAAEFGEEATLS
ncbi:MAG: hypothetical protein ACREQ5_38185 [Candidatus Dormibacteria bacterium]